ncbi:MAG: hypothetical protein JWM27_2825 [Gemmatimonadetes bacterium]|nr:hypothetical protein [Gemmatimonadota bacterium]
MKQARRVTLAVCLALLAAGCILHRGRPRDLPPPQYAALAGVWENPETQDRHTIRWERGRYTVASVESSGGERYVVTDVQWLDGVLRWGYRLPTTHYLITLRTRRVTPTALELDWADSDGNTRDETLRRVRGR